MTLISVTTVVHNEPLQDFKKLVVFKKYKKSSVNSIANRLGNPGTTVSEWLILTPKNLIPIPEKIAFPKPPQAPDGSLLYERIPNKIDLTEKISTTQCSIKKRSYDDVNGVDSKYNFTLVIFWLIDDSNFGLTFTTFTRIITFKKKEFENGNQMSGKLCMSRAKNSFRS